MEKHRVLIVDEDCDYISKLKNKDSRNYYFKHYEDWEGGISHLQVNQDDYDAIVIDAIVKLDADEKNGDKGNLHDALNELTELRRTDQIFIPHLIIGKGNSKFSKNESIIDKNDINNLFEVLKNLISSKDEYKIKIKYPEAFGAFEKGYLGPDDKKNLIEVLIDFENNTWSKNSFNPLRKVIEAVYKSIHDYDDELLPYSCVDENGKVNFEYCARRLSGRENTIIKLEKIPRILPHHIGWIIKPITQVCNITSHENKNEDITKYSLGTVLFGVIDLLIWYKLFIDKNYM